MKLKDYGLTQAEAAELLGTSQPSVAQALQRGNGPLAAGVRVLAAVWPMLTDEQRAEVRARVASLGRRSAA